MHREGFTVHQLAFLLQSGEAQEESAFIQEAQDVPIRKSEFIVVI